MLHTIGCRAAKLAPRWCVAAAVVLTVGLSGPAVRAQNGEVFKDSPQVKAAFRKVVEQARQCVVEIVCQADGDDKPVPVALGTIVGADGWIVTKASELRGQIVCKLRQKGQHVAKLVGVSNEYDLAMLKIDADELPVAVWDASAKFIPGQWVATAGTTEDPLAVGVVSTVRRQILAGEGVLGIEPEGQTTKLKTIADGSAAKKVGLKPGDTITHVNNKPVANFMELRRVITSFPPYTTVKLTVRRGEEYLTLEPTLQARPPAFQDQLGQALSKRSAGFPAALQHDTVLKPNQCGGPLVGLQGKVLGLNIARAGRVVSYAVPSDVVVGLLSDLKSGKLAPSAALLATMTPPRLPLEAPTPKPPAAPKEKAKSNMPTQQRANPGGR